MVRGEGIKSTYHPYDHIGVGFGFELLHFIEERKGGVFDFQCRVVCGKKKFGAMRFVQ